MPQPHTMTRHTKLKKDGTLKRSGGPHNKTGQPKKERVKTHNVQIRCTEEAYDNIKDRIKKYAEEEEKRVAKLAKQKGVEL